MQLEAIRAVDTFSNVAGLKLNIAKSSAIRLGAGLRSGGTVISPADGATERQDERQRYDRVREVQEVRYLGHVVGIGDTTSVAWNKAFSALQVRLALAEAKTNTVVQMVLIASAIIVPKLLYVGRHAWPTQTLVKEADLRIRHFVWKASFTVLERPPHGWILKELAELSPQQGGVGIPNILTELIAMGSSMVLEWGMAETVQEQMVGTILQGQGYGGHLEECHTNPTPILASSQWATGKSWADFWMAAKGPSSQHGRASTECIRQQMRVKWGLQLCWTREGLEIRCEGKLRMNMEQIRAKRRKLYGDFIHEAHGSIELATIALWNDQGQQRNWKDYSAVIRGANSKRLKDLCMVTHRQRGVTTFSPCTELRAGVGRQAKQFSELCLNILAAYPELACRGKEEAELRVRHGLEDQHHGFELVGEDKRVLQHSWCREVTTKALAEGQFNIQETIPTILGVEKNSMWVVPQPWISKLRPLWTGI